MYSHQYLTKLNKKIEKYSRKYKNSSQKMAFKLAFFNLKYGLFGRPEQKMHPFTDDRQHIGVEVAGGLGDMIIAAKYIHQLSQHTGENAVYDILGEEKDLSMLTAIFGRFPRVAQVRAQNDSIWYDIKLRIVRFPQVIHCREERLAPKLRAYVRRLVRFEAEHPALLQSDYLGRCYSLQCGRTRENQADIDNLLGMEHSDFRLPCPESREEVLAKFGLERKKFMVLQTGAGRHFASLKKETRTWPLEYYHNLAALLKKHFPEYAVVQAGAAQQPAIAHTDANLCGRTSIEELFCLLTEAKLYIAQEGGMAIARHFLQGGKSLVLFGPTDEKFFGFRENVNLAARPCSGSCEWLTNDWMKQCLVDAHNAVCMQNITPQAVIESIEL